MGKTRSNSSDGAPPDRRDFLDDAFRKEARRRLAVLGISQAELARRLGMSGATLSDTLNGKLVTSRFAIAIRKELGMPPPVPMAEDHEGVSRLLDPFHRLRAADRELLIAVAKRLAGDPRDDD